MLQSSLISLSEVFSNIIHSHSNSQSWQWILEASHKIRVGISPTEMGVIYSSVPSKTRNSVIQLSDRENERISELLPGFSLKNWNTVRLTRVWLLMNLSTSDKTNYLATVNYLFKNAEMNELVALYSALPLLAFPEEWKQQCSEGIRSNIGDVLEAIMCDNPYPAAHLEESAWNQMILKAFFTEKDIDRIIGVEARSNSQLSLTLSDYAAERTAAGRTVNPKLWPLVNRQAEARS